MDNLRKVGRHIKLPLQHKNEDPNDKKEWDFEYLADSKLFQSLPSGSKPVKIDDLNSKDRERIRKMAEKEYYRLAKKHGVEQKLKDIMKHQKEKLNTNLSKPFFGSTSVFGVKLKTLMERDQKIVPYCRVPLVAKMLFDCLEKKELKDKGILSTPTTDFATLNDLKTSMTKNFYDNRMAIEQKLMASSPTVAGDILKFFIRHIPYTLFTSDYADSFYNLGRIKDEEDQLKAMRMLILQLPDVNCNLLVDLLSLMEKIAGGTVKNEGIVSSLAFVMTPVLFDMPNVDLKDSKQVGAAGFPYDLTQRMIHCGETLFFVPPFMLNELRQKHERDAKEKTNGQVSVVEGKLAITAPQFNLINFKLNITPSSTVGEIMDQFFDSIKSKVTPPEQLKALGLCLMKPENRETFVLDHGFFEVGGNVTGERKLSNETKISNALRENPKAKWFIRCTHKQ